jgi:hypothetical protein
MKRTILKVLLAVVVLIAAELVWERFSVHNSDLRRFDAAAVGRLDTGMWRSYYERRPVLLFRQLITTLRTQFQLPPLRAVVNAYRAAHAAFVFKDGKNRADYEKALPDLEAYYADIARQGTTTFDSQQAARLELEWWILHRERSPQLGAALAAVQAEIYRVPAAALDEHARLRAEAMLLRDDKGQGITEADWIRIADMLDRSWKSLYAAVQKPGSYGTSSASR